MANALTRRLRRGKAIERDRAPSGRGRRSGRPNAEAATDAIETAGQADETAAAEGYGGHRRRRSPAKTGVRAARFGAWLGRPMTSFHLIIAVAALLTTLGLIMVLSASGVRSYGADGSAWVIFGKQVLWTIIGLIAAYVAMRMSVRFIRRRRLHRLRWSRSSCWCWCSFPESATWPTAPASGS